MKLILITFAVVLLRCCWGPTDFQMMVIQDRNMSSKKLDGTFLIKRLGNTDVSNFNLSITFNKNTKQVSGFSGCNRFFASYTLENNVLKFDSLGSTKMLCEVASNDIEQKFIKALSKVHLVLFNDNGISMLHHKKLLLSAIQETSQEPIKIQYTAFSRGFYKQISMDKKTMTSSQKRGEKPSSKPCEEKHWNTITKLLKPLDVENISTLKAPSKKFQFDGAAIAHLKIIKGDKTYESAAFDHGNPPKEIENLVKEILSISENIE